MDSWKEELLRAIAQGLNDSNEEFDKQLIEDISFALEEPYLEQETPQNHRLEVASMGGSMCTGTRRHGMNASSRIIFLRIQYMMP